MKDVDIVLMCALRYSLGRRTYVTSVVSQAIVDEWDNVSVQLKHVIQHEIANAIEEHRSGSGEDTACWRKIIELPI